MNWYLNAFKKYFEFSGRARRKEFWMFLLFHYIFIFLTVFLVFSLTGDLYESDETNYVFVTIICTYLLLSFIPSLAITVRRLHDSGKSGWWLLLNLIPYIGWFVILIFTCFDSNPGENKWGPNPKKFGNDELISQIGTE
jgi:uncharacterized membrane protein YhaH (DUF805 family)